MTSSFRSTWNRVVAVTAVALLLVALASCTAGRPDVEKGGSDQPSSSGREERHEQPTPLPNVGAGTYGVAIKGPGKGEFVFDPPGSLSDRPVKVYYLAPPGGASTADIVIVMHGTGRDGEEYRADWEPLVRGRNVLVLVPEFDEDEYPGASGYNLGNLVDAQDHLRPREQWSFSVIERLFDYVVADVHSTAQSYAMFGHSAGAQFVHRFVEFTPGMRARIAVAANAGWYTVPDDHVPFPYGLGGSPLREKDMQAALAAHLVILLGADDVDPEDDSLRRDAGSDAQGVNRLERGRHFFQTAKKLADERSLPFAWRMVMVPGVAHSHTDMARAAAPLILADTR